MKMKITIPSRIANGFWDFGCLRVIVPKFSHFNNSMEETSAEDLELKKNLMKFTYQKILSKCLLGCIEMSVTVILSVLGNLSWLHFSNSFLIG